MAWTQGSLWFTLIPLFFCTDAMQYIRDYSNVKRKIDNHPIHQDIVTEIVTIFHPVSSPRSTQYERALPTSSSIQKLHEQPRRRYNQGGVVGISHRHQNVSNKYESNRKKIPIVSSRTGTGAPGKVVNQFIPEIPEECKENGICTDVPNYPKEYINKLIDQLGPAADKYKVEELEPEVTSRLGPVDNIIELCAFRHDIVIPDAARDKEDKWHFILNSKDKPLQGYRASICMNSRKSCRTDLISVPYGYDSMCQQKFNDRIMTGIDANGVMVEKPFQLPSCCNCVLRKL